jgi:beta-lactamase class A
MYYVFPVSFNNLVKQILFPTKININTETMQGLAFKNTNNINGADLYSMTNPLTNYVNNDLFMNRLMLTPTIEKVHSEVTTMYHTTEMKELKNQLKDLIKQYPSIHPAIYVWEYENGQYLEINADEQFAAASIIKIPVLVRLFKSIEAKQMTIYDDMILTDYYKASGSGDLQYSATGRKYSLDQLAKTMIQDSDNSATNMLISKMGGMDDINIGLRDWGISKTYVRTWLPDLNGTNKTTASDLAKILYNLDNPGFLNINSREYIIDYMSHVKNNKLIAAGLGEGALFAHKTGDIGTMLGDAGIVYAPNNKKYIIVILANRPYNSPQGKDFIVKASNLIYKSIVK